MVGTMSPQAHAHLQENTAPRSGTFDRTIDLALSRERGAAKRGRQLIAPAGAALQRGSARLADRQPAVSAAGITAIAQSNQCRREFRLDVTLGVAATDREGRVRDAGGVPFRAPLSPPAAM